MELSYYNTKGKALAARKNEYASIYSAAAEIVDNSIEAGATEILILLETTLDKISGKKVTSKISFIDNGCGMSPTLLQKCVCDGGTTKAEKGTMGKFGVGMNQASLFASPKFEVYSWESGKPTFYQSVDYDQMRLVDDYKIKESIQKEKPLKIINLLPSSYQHGTIVVWSKVDKDNHHMAGTIASKLSSHLGRVFRYYINSGKVRIYTSSDNKNPEIIQPRDPLHLMNNDYFLGDPKGTSKKYTGSDGESLFEPFKHELLNSMGTMKMTVPYYDKNYNLKQGEITIIASVIKEKFYYNAALKDGYQQPGDTQIGKYVKEYANGISILRAEREIDYNYFDFYNSTNQPNDRWFRLQISFNRELDDIFGVSNNKQHIELKQVELSQIFHLDPLLPNYPLWVRLEKHVKTLIGAMRTRNSAVAALSKKEHSNSSVNNIEVKSKTKNEQKIKMVTDKVSNNNFIQKELTDVYQSKLDEMSVIVVYDHLRKKKKYDCEFNLDLRKYIITFDIDSIGNQFSKEVELIFVCLIIEAHASTSYSVERKILSKLFNEYITVFNLEV